MGKWKYINLIVLIVAIIYMYLHIYKHYEGNTVAYITASLGILTSYALGHYIFVHNLKKPQKKKNDPMPPPVQPAIDKSKPKARPKVVLKPKPKNNG